METIMTRTYCLLLFAASLFGQAPSAPEIATPPKKEAPDTKNDAKKAPVFPPDVLNPEEAAELEVLIRILKAAQADIEAMEKITQPAGQISVGEIVIRYKDRQATAAGKAREADDFIKSAMRRRGYGEDSKAGFDVATKKFILPPKPKP